MNNEHAKRIQNAIVETKTLIPGYYEKTVAQRSPKTGCGSVVTSYKGQPLYDGIGHAVFYDGWDGWEEYPTCPCLMEGCTAFINRYFGGELGVVSLDDLPADSDIILDDRKNTGNVSATVKGVRGKKVDFIVAILGPEQGKEVLFTFHPGDPVNPSRVKTETGMHGRHVTVAEALKMGLQTAKIV